MAIPHRFTALLLVAIILLGSLVSSACCCVVRGLTAMFQARQITVTVCPHCLSKTTTSRKQTEAPDCRCKVASVADLMLPPASVRIATSDNSIFLAADVQGSTLPMAAEVLRESIVRPPDSHSLQVWHCRWLA